MSGGKRFLLGVIVIAAVVVGVRTLREHNKPANPDAAALTVYRLTPNDLSQACGTPERDVTDRLVADDGIRDIIYVDSSGRRLAFRFLRDGGADSGWCAFGVWANVTDPDGLGDPLDDADAVRHLPCLARTAAAKEASETFQASTQLVAHPAAAIAFIFPQVREVPVVPPVVPPIPVPLNPMPTLTPFPTSPPPVLDLPRPVATSAPSATPLSPTSEGASPNPPPPPDPPDPPPPPSIEGPRVVLVPCIGFSERTQEACELIDSALLVKDLNETLQAPNPMGRIDELVTKLTGHDFRIIQLPALLADHAEVIKAIFQLEIQTVNLVSTQLQHDLTKLRPMKWDTPAEKARKLVEVRAHETQVLKMWQEAAEDSRPSQSMSDADDDNSHGRFHMNDNSALRQAVQVHAINWKGF